MSLPQKTREDVLTGAAVFIAAALGVAFVASYGACAATPAQQAQAAKSEQDICRLRLLAVAFEALNPELQPPPGSVRAELETAEDDLCAKLLDAAPAP